MFVCVDYYVQWKEAQRKELALQAIYPVSIGCFCAGLARNLGQQAPDYGVIWQGKGFQPESQHPSMS